MRVGWGRLLKLRVASGEPAGLARSPARQIPLGPTGDEVLPEEVAELMEWAKDASDLNELLPARNGVLGWLRGL